MRLLGAVVVATALAAHAEDEGLDLIRLMDLKIKVVTASKLARDVNDAPAVIEVVTAEDLRRRGFRTVAEALSWMVGFYVVDDHVLPNVSVRGVSSGLMTESGLLKVMVDGQPVTFRSTGGNWLGLELIPLQTIERIEVVRGPGSALYGADAFLGVVNVITVDGGGFDQILATVRGGVLGTASGARGDAQLDVSGGTRVGPVEVVAGATAELADRGGLILPASSPAPQVPTAAAGRGSTSAALPRRSLSVFAKAGLTFAEGRGNLKATFGYARIARGGDFTHWAQLTAADATSGTLVSLEQLRGSLTAEVPLGSNVVMRLAGTYFQGNPLADDVIDVASDFYVVRRRFSFKGFSAAAEVVARLHERLQLVGGAEFVFDLERLPARRRYDRDGTAIDDEPAVVERPFLNPAVYAQVEWHLVPQFAHLTGGVRFDYHNIYGPQLSGRVGVVSHWSTALTTKVLYGNAFKAPSTLLLFGSPLRPGDIIGNPDLKPQRVHTVEAQATVTPVRWIDLSASAAWSLLLDRAEFRPVGINVAAENVARQNVFSLEVQGTVRPNRWVRLHASADLQYGMRDSGDAGYRGTLVGTANVAYPVWIFRGGGTLRLGQAPLELNVDAMLVGPRRASESNIFLAAAPYELPTTVLVNAGLQTTELDSGFGRTRLSLNLYNLTNSSVADPGYAGVDLPRLPVEVVLGVTHAY